MLHIDNKLVRIQEAEIRYPRPLLLWGPGDIQPPLISNYSIYQPFFPVLSCLTLRLRYCTSVHARLARIAHWATVPLGM